MSVHISATTDPERHLSSAMDPITAAAFPIQHYEVTPGCLCCLVLCPETLVLETEEVEYKRVTPCSTDVKRLPYGQLGSVDKYSARPLPCTDPSASSALAQPRNLWRVSRPSSSARVLLHRQTACGCCIAVDSNLTPGEANGISPGCGCQNALVAEIVEELKARQKARGDTGNIKRAEQTIDLVTEVKSDVAELTAKVDAIMRHLNIPVPQKIER